MAQGLPLLLPPAYRDMEDDNIKDTVTNDENNDDNLNAVDNNVKILVIDTNSKDNTKKNTKKSKDLKEKDTKDKKQIKDPKKKKRNLWWLKIGIISFGVSAVISIISELTASAGELSIILILLFVLVFISIIFDGIGVATASCDIVPIRSMASKKIYGAKTALWIVKHNEKVANICNDVIGDTIGVISGACTAAIVVQLVQLLGEQWQQILTIVCSSLVAAITIGGKAFLKNIAINKSKEFVMTFAKVIAIFSPEENRRRRAQKAKKKKQKEEQLKKEKETQESNNK